MNPYMVYTGTFTITNQSGGPLAVSLVVDSETREKLRALAPQFPSPADGWGYCTADPDRLVLEPGEAKTGTVLLGAWEKWFETATPEAQQGLASLRDRCQIIGSGESHSLPSAEKATAMTAPRTATEAPGGGRASETRPEGCVTLVELRQREPLCGVPAGYWTEDNVFDDTPTVRLQLLSKEEFDSWLDATNRVTQRGLGYVKALTAFVQKMSILFEGESFKPDLSQRFVARLNSIPVDAFALWQGTIEQVFDTAAVSEASVAWTLAAVDEFYDAGDRYLPEKSDRYLARLQGLSKDHVDLWAQKIPVFDRVKDDAALSITLVDDFFPGERFDQKIFNEVMNQAVPAR